jgi:hypothetical protein
MRAMKYYLGISLTGLMAFLVYSCKTSSPGDAVKAAMEREIIKEKAEELIDEQKVPEVVVAAFIKNKPDIIERTWLVYKETPEEEVKVKIPEVYIVAYRDNDQDYRAKYSKEGDIINLNQLISLSILPDAALNTLQKGEYRDWEVTGDVYETLDNITNEPIGFIVKVKKADQSEKLFFDLEGNIVKIQELSQ